MTRPRSIRLFSLFWIAALVLTLLGSAVSWSALLDQAAAQAGAATLGRGTLNAIAGVGVAVLAAIFLVLWYGVARRGWVAAKWIAALFTAYSVYTVAGADQASAALATTPGLIAAVSLLLQVIAVALLFAPEARPWFAAQPEDRP